MLKKFYPNYRYKSIADIEDDFFKRNNIKNVVLDIDNTLVPYTVAKPNDFALDFINRLKNEGISVCLLSNNNKRRVTLFNSELGLNALHNAAKPLTKKLRSALQSINATPADSAIIGDQLFTDVYCGNRLNMITVLVEPLENKEDKFFQFKRKLEKKIINKIENRRNNND